MDVGILAQKIEGYVVSGSPGATAIALHGQLWSPLVFTISVFLIILRLGGPTKSCIKMKQKEQIKIARDLILNGLSEQTVLHLLPVIVHILTFSKIYSKYSSRGKCSRR